MTIGQLGRVNYQKPPKSHQKLLRQFQLFWLEMVENDKTDKTIKTKRCIVYRKGVLNIPN